MCVCVNDVCLSMWKVVCEFMNVCVFVYVCVNVCVCGNMFKYVKSCVLVHECVCICVCVFVCVNVCVATCLSMWKVVWERERERGREREGEREVECMCIFVCVCTCAWEREREVVFVFMCVNTWVSVYVKALRMAEFSDFCILTQILIQNLSTNLERRVLVYVNVCAWWRER